MIAARRGPVAWVAALVAAGAAVSGTAWWFDQRGPASGPAPVSAGAATCPAAQNADQPSAPWRRGGDLVPSEPTSALLCVYPPAEGLTWDLERTLTIDAPKAEALARYLNGRPSTVEAELVCLDIGRTGYAVVFAYPDGHATVPLGCELHYAGARRATYNLGVVLKHWGLSVNDA